MKYIKLYIIIIFTAVVLVCSCTDLSGYILLEKHDSEVALYESKLKEANSVIDSNSVEIIGLEKEVNNLEDTLNLTEEELLKYESLISNLNELLSNIYIGYAENENYVSEGFTAFSLNYEDKIFLITAGHCIHYNFEGLDTGLYTTIKFRQNNGNWIYAKLLTYENDYVGNRDYAILYSDKINNGLDFDINNNFPKFILGNGNINTVKNFSIYALKDKESGSPIIDIDGEVIEIATGNYVDIDLIIEAIDSLEK